MCEYNFANVLQLILLFGPTKNKYFLNLNGTKAPQFGIGSRNDFLGKTSMKFRGETTS